MGGCDDETERSPKFKLPNSGAEKPVDLESLKSMNRHGDVYGIVYVTKTSKFVVYSTWVAVPCHLILWEAFKDSSIWYP